MEPVVHIAVHRFHPHLGTADGTGREARPPLLRLPLRRFGFGPCFSRLLLVLRLRHLPCSGTSGLAIFLLGWCVCVYLSKALPPLNPHLRAPQTTPMQPPPGLLALAGGGKDARAAWRYRKMKKTEREMAPACSRLPLAALRAARPTAVTPSKTICWSV